jgi:rhodanese-related sulfurtransferase
VHDALARRQAGLRAAGRARHRKIRRATCRARSIWRTARSSVRNWPNYPADTLFVTYCAGPHCNGAARAAIRLAKLGRPVKIMAGGITGWLDEGFSLVKGGS